jgi:transcriptional regulator with GAF, ATPase, and Fis domain
MQDEAGAPPGLAERSRAYWLRSWVAVPMMQGGRGIGAIAVGRRGMRPFSEKNIALLQTFAHQAVIAVENVRLFKELEARNRDLTEALEQQTATSEILRVISNSSTDLQPVLYALAQSAARLCGANDAQIYRVEGDSLRRVPPHGPILPSTETRAISRAWVTGRAVVDRRTIHLHDLGAETDVEYPDAKAYQQESGHRTTLATPLLREGVALGAILIRRMKVVPFSEKQK